MKCPKCSQNIDENALSCPYCKKVLLLVCPKCGVLNKKNTCKKCGFIIVTKCYKCGKINQTHSGACTKCGFSTYTSASINSSNIDAFACMTIEFPNISEIKTSLGSTKLYEKFKSNLDNLILNYTKSIDLTREIIDNIYIIRFNKDYTFTESANNAIKSAIEIQNLVTELNFKLQKSVLLYKPLPFLTLLPSIEKTACDKAGILPKIVLLILLLLSLVVLKTIIPLSFNILSRRKDTS